MRPLLLGTLSSSSGILFSRSPRQLLPSLSWRSFSNVAPVRNANHQSLSVEQPLSPAPEPVKGLFFVDRVFPIRVSYWDIRYLFATFRERKLVKSLRERLESVTSDLPGFKVLHVDTSRPKDGGVFVDFEYRPPSSEGSLTVERIQDVVRKKVDMAGGLPSWFGAGRSTLWPVGGRPWTEDLHRYACGFLKVQFEGPDVDEEVLYKLFRPFGRIQDISTPVPVPTGAFRSSLLEFDRVAPAVRALNCLHGLVVSNPDGTTTRLSICYEHPLKAHVVSDFISRHGRVMLPLIVLVFGFLTYTIFDPIRALMVRAKVEKWFDYKDYRPVRWILRNITDRLQLSIDFSSSSSKIRRKSAITWAERKEAETAIEKYLNDAPTTLAFLHGPQGSGKSSSVHRLVSESNRPYIEIDCAKLSGANSDAAVIRQLAGQTGYFPVFSGLAVAWVNNMIDFASVALVGQTAGFSKTVEEQLKDVLDVVGSALKHVNSSHAQRGAKPTSSPARTQQRSSDTTNYSVDTSGPYSFPRVPSSTHDQTGLPIVILKNFDVKGATKRERLLDVLADWSAALVENQIAHVIISSNNRESMKRITRAAGSRPLVSVAFADADTQSALSIVSARMEEAQLEVHRILTKRDVECIKLLGGRASDLDALVFKVRSGLSIEEGVDDIITRTLTELRRSAFGDDRDDAKRLPWMSEQVWLVISRLAAHSEIPYSETLLEFPFKGDDAALREMEKAELINIITEDGFPVTIRPGRPVYHHVFERLAKDQVFAAVQEINANTKLIEAAELTVKACEEELSSLRNIVGFESSRWLKWKWRQGAVSFRADAVLGKMEEAARRLERLERENRRLKMRLARRREKSAAAGSGSLSATRS